MNININNTPDSSPNGNTMSEWIHFERLPRNDLPLPRYESEKAAGMDFAACLSRPCKSIITSPHHRPEKKPFLINGSYRHYIPESDFPSDEYEKFDHSRLFLQPKEVIMVPLGFKSEFGDRYVLRIHIRSSVGLAGLMLANGTGIIDPDYRGELFAVVWNRTDHVLAISHGQRIAQGVLDNFTQAIIQEVNNVTNTPRGDGGFGSTGTIAGLNSNVIMEHPKP